MPKIKGAKKVQGVGRKKTAAEKRVIALKAAHKLPLLLKILALLRSTFYYAPNEKNAK